MNAFTKRTTLLAALLAALVVLGFTTGCAGNAPGGKTISLSDPVSPQWSIENPSAMLVYAIDLKRQGHYEASADAFEELIHHWASSDRRFEMWIWEQIGYAYLASGEQDGFYRAADAIYTAAGGRESPLTETQRTLIAIADKRRGRDIRISIRSLSPRIRALVESGPVDAWRLQ